MNAFTSTPTQPILHTIESTEDEKLVPAEVSDEAGKAPTEEWQPKILAFCCKWCT